MRKMLAVCRQVWQDDGMTIAFCIFAIVAAIATMSHATNSAERAEMSGELQGKPYIQTRISRASFLFVFAMQYACAVLLAHDRAAATAEFAARGGTGVPEWGVSSILLALAALVWSFFLLIAYMRRIHDFGMRLRVVFPIQAVAMVLLTLGCIYLGKSMGVPDGVLAYLQPQIVLQSLTLPIGLLPSDGKDNRFGKHIRLKVKPCWWKAALIFAAEFLAFLCLNVWVAAHYNLAFS